MCALDWDMGSEINAKNDGMGVTTPVHKGPHDLLKPTLRKHGYLHRQNTTVAHWGILSSGGHAVSMSSHPNRVLLRCEDPKAFACFMVKLLAN